MFFQSDGDTYGLVFQFSILMLKQTTYHPRIRSNYGDSQPNIGCSQFIEKVSLVLAQLRDPNVDEFRVFCYNLHDTYSFRIDEWIRFALSNRVHTIELNLSNFKSLCFSYSCNT